MLYGRLMYINWQVNEAGEKLSGVYKFELVQHMYNWRASEASKTLSGEIEDI